MKFGEIYICRFPLTSGAQSKPRPTLVLIDLGLLITPRWSATLVRMQFAVKQFGVRRFLARR
jgi:hypothetical protein